MSSDIVRAFVAKADGNVILVKLLDDTFINELISLGFVSDTNVSEYFLSVNGDAEKGKVFESLRDLDVSFSGGKEWCPSEVFEYLRDSGSIKGRFKRISWRAPGDYHLTVE